MKQTVAISDLRIKLQLAQAALDEKGLLDFTGNVIFHGHRIFAGNDKIVIIGPAPFDFDFSVNGTDLNTVLEGAGENADFQLKDGKVHIKSGKIKAKLASADMEGPLSWLQESGLEDEAHWQPLPEDFIQALDWCKFSASKDVSDKAGTCLKVLDNRVLSTDLFRISRYTMKESMGITAMIPKEVVPVIIAFPGIKEFCKISDSWLCFHNPETNMICGVRLVIGDLPPKIETFFDETGEEIKLPEGLKTLIKRSGKFVEGVSDEAKTIDIRIKDGEISCTGLKERGYFKQNNELDYHGPEMSFLVIPALFEQILDKVQVVNLCGNHLSFHVGPFDHLMVVNIALENPDED